MVFVTIEMSGTKILKKKAIQLLGEQNITIDLLQSICEALNVKMSDLLKEAGS